MNGSFQKFKRKALFLRICKAILAGLSLGCCVGGILLALSRLAILTPPPTVALAIGAAVGAVTATILLFLLRKSDAALARELDARLGLSERVQTAIAFREDAGGMIELQRADADMALERLGTRVYKAKRLWVYIVSLVLGAAILTCGFFAPYRRDYTEPEVIPPYEITEVQIAGLEELIRYVEESDMETVYSERISDALGVLLADLRAATTEPERDAALALALTEITETTYDSSSMTEILNALWGTEDAVVRKLALTLNTSGWSAPDWGDFAEKYAALRDTLTATVEGAEDAQAVAELRQRIDSLVIKTENALLFSKIPVTDPLHAVLLQWTGETEDASVLSLSEACERMDGMCAADASAAILQSVSDMTDRIYAVISAQKINTNVGEYVLGKLSALFGVPIPAFERPLLSENVSGGTESDREEGEGTGGGVGEGAVFGSDDLVLDPITGEYVEYGRLYADYNLRMLERLENEEYGYTEAQKKAIEKYFALLYGGLKEEEGN